MTLIKKRIKRREGGAKNQIKIRNVTKNKRCDCFEYCINMELKSGTVYGLQGKNGSGKTMLLRLLCGFILPSEGEVEINGKVFRKGTFISGKCTRSV